jgi:hypothetical protein
MVHKFKKAPTKEEACCLPGEGLTDEEFASFCKTPEEIKKLPAGTIEYEDGTVLFVDGAGQQWTAEQWMKRFGYEPNNDVKKVWDRMRSLNLVVLGGRGRRKANQKISVAGKNPAQGDTR